MFYHGGSSSSGGRCADAADYANAVGQLRRELQARRRSSAAGPPPVPGPARSSISGTKVNEPRSRDGDSSTQLRRRRTTTGISDRHRHRRHHHKRRESSSQSEGGTAKSHDVAAPASDVCRHLPPSYETVVPTTHVGTAVIVVDGGLCVDRCNSLTGTSPSVIRSPPHHRRRRSNESPSVHATSPSHYVDEHEVATLARSSVSCPPVDEVFDDADRHRDDSEDGEDDGDEPLSFLHADAAGGATSSRRVVLNVGGTRHEVPWKTLARLPRSRLGRLATCRTRRELAAQCDDYDLDSPTPEFFFDRNPRSFASVLDFYRTGRLHVADEAGCVLAYGDDLSYWAVDELYMEACCQQRYQQRKEQVLDILRKELENLTLGGSDDDGGDGAATALDGVAAVAAVDSNVQSPDAQIPVVTRWRRNVWDLMEKPQSSLSARVSN
jgi:hypothetical protein